VMMRAGVPSLPGTRTRFGSRRLGVNRRCVARGVAPPACLYYTSLLVPRAGKDGNFSLGHQRLRRIPVRPKFLTITHIVLLPQFLQRAKGCCCGSGALLELMHDEQHGDSA
jgi:hypothetical protein